MESKSIVIHKGGKEEKYKLYVEDYVLSYLKYETGSLECSEIYFYGARQNNDRKYIIYGAGRDKLIPVFDTYDLLEEIMCRLTQAGPVFMVRESEEVYQVKGFDVFYQDNEAMQGYMVERQKNFARPRAAEQKDKHGATVLPAAVSTGKTETRFPHSHGIISAQLGVILIILVAIVINSANSYDKMEQLNQSAEEVFFAIENQEADDSVSDAYAPGEEVVVKRDKDQENAQTNENAQSTEDEEKSKADQVEGEALEDINIENMGTESKEENSVITQQETENNAKEEGLLKEAADTETEPKEEDEEQTEALSRNVTRYYEVEQGDTLCTICQKIYGDTSQVEKICELNDILDPDRIRPGQKIILP